MPTAPRSFALLVVAFLTTAAQAAPGPAASMVRISTTAQQPDYSVPWNPGNVGSGVGAGFLIDGKRILTNAQW
jgi:hypothetical protein